MKKLLISGALLMASTPLIMSASTQSALIVGNDRDMHGCIGSAGYVWSDSAQKCIRPWEQTGSTLDSNMPPAQKPMSGTDGTPPAQKPMFPDEMVILRAGISQLSPTDRAEIIQIIHTYLDSKSITLPTFSQKRDIKQEDPQELKQEVKSDKQKLQETIKQKQVDTQKRLQKRHASLAR